MNTPMRKAVIITTTILSGLMILDSLHAGHAFMMFLLAGIIPGTTLSLSPTMTLELFALLFGFVLSRVVVNLTRQAFSQSTQRA